MINEKIAEELKKELDLDDKQLEKFCENCELGDTEIEYEGNEIVEMFIRLRLSKRDRVCG